MLLDQRAEYIFGLVPLVLCAQRPAEPEHGRRVGRLHFQALTANVGGFHMVPNRAVQSCELMGKISVARSMAQKAATGCYGGGDILGLNRSDRQMRVGILLQHLHVVGVLGQIGLEVPGCFGPTLRLKGCLSRT